MEKNIFDYILEAITESENQRYPYSLKKKIQRAKEEYEKDHPVCEHEFIATSNGKQGGLEVVSPKCRKCGYEPSLYEKIS
jgi:predicted Zn-ribbon and HTH transcriptional regulator